MSSLGWGGHEDSISDEFMFQILMNMLKDLCLNKNFFTTDLSDSEDTEILEAYGYLVHKTEVRDNGGEKGSVSVALPSSLSSSEVSKMLKGFKTYDDIMPYSPKVVLERENRKLYVKLMKKLINDLGI